MRLPAMCAILIANIFAAQTSGAGWVSYQTSYEKLTSPDSGELERIQSDLVSGTDLIIKAGGHWRFEIKRAENQKFYDLFITVETWVNWMSLDMTDVESTRHKGWQIFRSKKQQSFGWNVLLSKNFKEALDQYSANSSTHPQEISFVNRDLSRDEAYAWSNLYKVTVPKSSFEEVSALLLSYFSNLPPMYAIAVEHEEAINDPSSTP